MRSIRRTLLVALLGAVLAVTVVAVAATYRIARQEIDELLDYQLRQAALSVSDRAAARAAGGGDLVFQIWDQSGVRLYVSRPGAGLPPVRELGFATVSAPSGGWRVYSTLVGEQVVEVAQPLEIREEMALSAVRRTLAPLLLLLPLLAALVWAIVGRALQPLERLAGAAAARTPAALDPFDERDVPEEAVPLVRSLNGLLARLRSALGATRIADDAVATGDAGALRTLLANIAGNAVAHTPAGGRVDVSAGVEDGRPFLEVADTGPGIPETERERVFDRFYRLPGAAGSGSGLGLAIVKAIADRHGAAVALRDTPGGGLTVRVTFPARAEAGAAPADAPRRPSAAAEEGARRRPDRSAGP